MTRRGSLAVSVALCSQACSTAPDTRVLSPHLHMGSMGASTRFERELQRPIDDDGPKASKVTPALFWTGAVLAIVGTAGAISFGAAGAAMDHKLDDGFGEGLTVDEEEQIRSRGSAFNRVAVGSLATALVGVGLAAIVYGVDYNRCGPMAPKKRACKRLHGTE